ncbi:MAG: transketolase family protein [bacterium]
MEFERGVATRTAYGEVLAQLGEEHENIVVLDGDLSKSTRTYMFAEKFPDRFYNVGIQEANMAGVAAGLAASGMVPFVSSFACFLTTRAYDQIRVSVAYADLPVKFVASHGGISGGEDGVTQQSIEDVALMASLPDMAVCVPADEHSTRSLVPQLLGRDTPCYLRTGRPKAPVVYEPDVEMKLGKAHLVREGADLTIVAQGLLVAEALKAADELAGEGIEAEVIDAHTVKPFDRETIAQSVQKTGRAVVAEEHQLWGGLGSTVARELSASCPVPMEFVAIEDTYAESGPGYELLEKYGLTSPAIVEASRSVIER